MDRSKEWVDEWVVGRSGRLPSGDFRITTIRGRLAVAVTTAMIPVSFFIFSLLHSVAYILPMKIYTYKNCGSCKKATKWLKEQGVDFEELPIRETPPAVKELKQMLAYQNGELKKLFNTAGGDYRELDMKTKLPSMSEAEAFELLASRGNLVKRPFVLGDGFGLVGFKEADWADQLCSSKS